MVLTCRTQEYEELLNTYTTRLELNQAFEILPLTDPQLDRAFVELAKSDKGWEELRTSDSEVGTELPDDMARRRARALLTNPLLLNLAVAGNLRPRELLDCDSEEELHNLILERYLEHRVLADRRKYEPADARRYLSWVARFLLGAEVSPFGRQATDAAVFDLADLTPPDPPNRYRLFVAPAAGLLVALFVGLVWALDVGLIFGVFVGLLARWPYKRSAVSSRLTLVWPKTFRQLLGFLARAGRGLVKGLFVGLFVGLTFGVVLGLASKYLLGLLFGLAFGLLEGFGLGLSLGLAWGLFAGLVEPRSVLITSRTPKEVISRSRRAALTWLFMGLLVGLVWAVLNLPLFPRLFEDLVLGLSVGLGVGLGLGLRSGGWFVLLQKVAHRHLAWARNLPRRPADFLEWGIERQIFRRVGGGVRFRHGLIQQHLAHTSETVGLTPPDPPNRYRLFVALAAGLFVALFVGLIWGVTEEWGERARELETRGESAPVGKHENLRSGDTAEWSAGMKITIDDVHIAPNEHRRRAEEQQAKEEAKAKEGRGSGPKGKVERALNEPERLIGFSWTLKNDGPRPLSFNPGFPCIALDANGRQLGRQGATAEEVANPRAANADAVLDVALAPGQSRSGLSSIPVPDAGVVELVCVHLPPQGVHQPDIAQVRETDRATWIFDPAELESRG